MFRVSNLNVSIGPIPIIRGAAFALEEGEMCDSSAATVREKQACSVPSWAPFQPAA